jgi:hypothetical protein
MKDVHLRSGQASSAAGCISLVLLCAHLAGAFQRGKQCADSKDVVDTTSIRCSRADTVGAAAVCFVGTALHMLVLLHSS